MGKGKKSKNSGAVIGELILILAFTITALGLYIHQSQSITNPPSSTPGVPSAPQGFSIRRIVMSTHSITIGWNLPAYQGVYVTSYVVYESVGNDTSGLETFLCEVTNMSITITGMSVNTMYYFKVAAVNAYGIGANATEIHSIFYV